MAGESLIGNLAVLLTMDTAAFEKGSTHAQKLLKRTQRQFEQMGNKMKDIGESMSKWITLPVMGAGAAVMKLAGDFQSAMNNVSISTQASAAEMAKMRKLALDIGKDTTKSASEAAGAMDMLAKAGMKTTDILNGGAKAVVALAEAAGSDLDPAAAAITDTFQQFNLSSKDLPKIVNNITGAVNESKFGFEDFQLGMAQAGGVAASAGVEFEDFTAALAATASQFASGSDAGTSMKTFLLSLTPSTKKAAKAFEEAGFNAYNTNGTLKSMAQIAGELALRFGHLSEQDLNATFEEMFGTDAIRTAIGLMKQGEAGIIAMQDRIAKTDAEKQAAQRMQGFNAELEKLKGAIETAAIAIADSGMLAAITSLVTGFAGLVDKLGELSPTTLKWVTIIAATVAALGPLIIVVGSAVSSIGVMLPLIVKMGGVFTLLKGVLIGLTPVLAAVRGILLSMLANPIILGAAVVIGGIYLAWKNWDKIGPIVQKMVTGVTNWLKKLASPFNWVVGKLTVMGKAFFALYDKVVGHSYIPDMVDGIAEQMARLEAVMVKPATAAAGATGEAFRKLQSDVAGLLDRLFPEAAAFRKYESELALIDKALKAHILTVEQAAEARSRLGLEGMKDTPISVLEDGAKPLTEGGGLTGAVGDAIDKLPELSDASDKATARVIEGFSNMANSAISSVRDMVASFKSGDILGSIQSLLDVVVDVIGALGQIGVIKAPANYGGARANGGPVSAGKSYLVGERGPEFITPRRSGFVHPNGSGAQQRISIVPSPYFDAVVDHRATNVAAPMASRAAMVGAAGGQQGIMRQQQRRIP